MEVVKCPGSHAGPVVGRHAAIIAETRTRTHRPVNSGRSFATERLRARGGIKVMKPMTSVRFSPFDLSGAALLLFLIGSAAIAHAQPVPALTNVPAVYLKQGDSVELTLTGQNLGDVTGIIVPNPCGLAAGLLEAEELSASEKAQASAAEKTGPSAGPDAKPAKGAAGGRGARAAAAKRARTDSKARVKL